METFTERKAKLRRQLRERLKTLSKEQKADWDRAICERVLGISEADGSEWVYGYASLSWEAGTWEILSGLLLMGKRLALPRVNGDEMEFFEIRSLSELSEGSYHIMEPKESCPLVREENALMLVPGMAFCRDGRRLGKGGGFYDKFLSREPGYKTLGLAYGFQILEELPAGELDRRVAGIVTPEEAWNVRT